MLHSAEFWVAVAFVIFWGILFYKGVPGKVLNQLDSRGKRIADELAEAKRLRQDAERLLKEYEAKRAAAEREAADIVSTARDEAERLAREAQEKMTDFVKRRTATAEAKIAQAEAQDGVEYSFGADPKFAETDAERALFVALDTAEPQIAAAVRAEDYPAAMAAIAALRAPIDGFFEAVQVNADNAVLRRNRLNLLHRIRETGRRIADFGRIEG